MPEWIIKYIGGGFLVIISYIIISNLLWLIIGARALQFLPGVNDKSAKGTIKILVLLLMTFLGIFLWFLKLIPAMFKIIRYKPILSEISASIQLGGRIHKKIEDHIQKK